MKSLTQSFAMLFFAGMCCLANMSNCFSQETAKEAKESKLYELRFYVANPGKLEALHDRFRNHTLKLFEKHGMENIIYWDVVEGDKTDGDKAKNMMIYIIAHKDEAARDASWKAFSADANGSKCLRNPKRTERS